MTKAADRTLPFVQTPIIGVDYYAAYLKKDGLLYKSGLPMSFLQAYKWVNFTVPMNKLQTALANNHPIGIPQSRVRNNVWGIYTPSQAAAEALATVVWPGGVISPPEVHGINYFGHYHDPAHNYHIWFGKPIP